jgi:hypothetical protein
MNKCSFTGKNERVLFTIEKCKCESVGSVSNIQKSTNDEEYTEL